MPTNAAIPGNGRCAYTIVVILGSALVRCLFSCTLDLNNASTGHYAHLDKESAYVLKNS